MIKGASGTVLMKDKKKVRLCALISRIHLLSKLLTLTSIFSESTVLSTSAKSPSEAMATGLCGSYLYSAIILLIVGLLFSFLVRLLLETLIIILNYKNI